MEVKELESAIEAILFAAGDPVGVERLCLALGQDRATVDGVCRRLADRFSYERRGVRIVQLDASWQMCSAPECAPVIRKVLESRRPAKLSQPALEVLAIIAYFQPVTRAYVDQVRGVDSAYTVGLLLERELIEEAGRLPVPGRPMQFRTTKNFLRTFGLTKLEELPELPGAVGEDGQLTLALEGLEGAAGQQTASPDAAAEADTADETAQPETASEAQAAVEPAPPEALSEAQAAAETAQPETASEAQAASEIVQPETASEAQAAVEPAPPEAASEAQAASEIVQPETMGETSPPGVPETAAGPAQPETVQRGEPDAAEASGPADRPDAGEEVITP